MFTTLNNNPFAHYPKELHPFVFTPDHYIPFNHKKNTTSATQENNTEKQFTNDNNKIPLTNDAKSQEDKYPYVDMTEYSNYYIIEAELPGFKKEDIEISFDNVDNIITLKGEYTYRPKKHENIVIVEEADETNEDDNASVSTSSVNDDGKHLLIERKLKKSFKRSFKVKHDILAEEIQADLTDGVLNLIIPKRFKKENKKIRIPIQ
ncbi:HSP20-like chaperone [Neoconidiobolus thromboides FSU 785]|nr:HSP20-like chaperone [Neoconidiobolus thromboides FSU 785]